MSNDKPVLDPRPARPLTSREALKIVCGVVGGLLEFSGEQEVRDAVRWLANDENWWAMMRAARVIHGSSYGTGGGS